MSATLKSAPLSCPASAHHHRSWSDFDSLHLQFLRFLLRARTQRWVNYRCFPVQRYSSSSFMGQAVTPAPLFKHTSQCLGTILERGELKRTQNEGEGGASSGLLDDRVRPDAFALNRLSRHPLGRQFAASLSLVTPETADAAVANERVAPRTLPAAFCCLPPLLHSGPCSYPCPRWIQGHCAWPWTKHLIECDTSDHFCRNAIHRTPDVQWWKLRGQHVQPVSTRDDTPPHNVALLPLVSAGHADLCAIRKYARSPTGST